MCIRDRFTSASAAASLLFDPCSAEHPTSREADRGSDRTAEDLRADELGLRAEQRGLSQVAIADRPPTWSAPGPGRKPCEPPSHDRVTAGRAACRHDRDRRADRPDGDQ